MRSITLTILLLSFYSLTAQSNQWIISTDIARIKPNLSFNANVEYSLGRKISLFTDILYQRREAGVGDQIGVDSITFGFPVPIYERFDIDEIWTILGSNFYITKSNNYNEGLYFSSFLFYNKLVKTEPGFIFELDDDILGMGIGLGFQGRIKKVWSLDLGIRTMVPFGDIDTLRIPGTDSFGYLRLGYILNPRSSNRSRRSGRRSSR